MSCIWKHTFTRWQASVRLGLLHRLFLCKLHHTFIIIPRSHISSCLTSAHCFISEVGRQIPQDPAGTAHPIKAPTSPQRTHASIKYYELIFTLAFKNGALCLAACFTIHWQDTHARICVMASGQGTCHLYAICWHSSPMCPTSHNPHHPLTHTT